MGLATVKLVVSVAVPSALLTWSVTVWAPGMTYTMEWGPGPVAEEGAALGPKFHWYVLDATGF